jgi:Domain of unknown function (DUF4440)
MLSFFPIQRARVAQWIRAFASGAKGRRFDPCRGYQIFSCHLRFHLRIANRFTFGKGGALMLGADEDKEPTNSELERELRRANEEWVRALAQRDGAVLSQIIANEFELAYPFEGDDKDQFISNVINGEVRVESLEPHSTTMRVSGGTGLVFGTETANWHYRNRNLSGTYRFIRVYTRQHGKWQIVTLHVCALHH